MSDDFTQQIERLDREIIEVAGLRGSVVGGDPADEFGFRRKPTTSGYAMSIAINAARARFAGPTYRTYRLTVRGHTLIEVRRRIESPRERMARRYEAFVRETYGVLSKREALGLWRVPMRMTWRERELIAYATVWYWLTAGPTYVLARIRHARSRS